jgi:pimeloyl-ACP methyl ester carboxylesterase
VREEPIEVAVDGGTLHGHVGGDGPPALLLHGGAAVTDYMDGLARELEGLVRTIRYQQRGTYPSIVGPPYTIEAHVSDALAVLDSLGLEHAWAIGHSWGGHLALHLAVLHPERVLGLVCIDSLGASRETLTDQDAAMRRGLSAEARARIEEVEALRRQGLATEEQLLERFGLLWPQWFTDPSQPAPNPVVHIGPAASTGTNASIAEHFAAGTLVRRLPELRLPTLFVHGELDPLPVRSSQMTAALIPNARVETIPDCSHFPWLERPGQLRRLVETFLAETSLETASRCS